MVLLVRVLERELRRRLTLNFGDQKSQVAFPLAKGAFERQAMLAVRAALAVLYGLSLDPPLSDKAKGTGETYNYSAAVLCLLAGATEV